MVSLQELLAEARALKEARTAVKGEGDRSPSPQPPLALSLPDAYIALVRIEQCTRCGSRIEALDGLFEASGDPRRGTSWKPVKRTGLLEGVPRRREVRGPFAVDYCFNCLQEEKWPE